VLLGIKIVCVYFSFVFKNKEREKGEQGFVIYFALVWDNEEVVEGSRQQASWVYVGRQAGFA